MKTKISFFLPFFQIFALIAFALGFSASAYATLCSSSGQYSSYEWIDGIQIGSYSHASGSNNGYADFTTTQIIPLESGENNLTLTPGFSYGSYPEYWSIWIDLNQDDIVDDSELVFSGSSSSAVNGTMTIPATALPGKTIMRVAMKYDSSSTPCETFIWGEVEDYTVDIPAGSLPEPPTPTLYTLNVDNNYILSRSGNIGEVAVWVIEKDGAIVLQRNAANELTYKYFNNTAGSKFRVWLSENGQQASNIVEYEAGKPVSTHEISVDENFRVTRDGTLDEPLTWVFEKDGVVVLQRNAANELDYTYFNNVNNVYYRVWLERFIDGAYEIVSNVVYYVPGAVTNPPPEPPVPTLYTINVDNSYVLSRTGELGDSVTWQIEKNGVIVLSRNASSDMTYKYYSNTAGSQFRVWLAVGGQQASNIVEYEVGSVVSTHELTVDANYMISRSGTLNEPLTWVIEKDGVDVLQRNAANELSYTYFSNVNNSYYRVWLEQFVNGAYEVVSNVVYYVPGVAVNPYIITLANNYDLTRDGNIGDPVSWVIEENGAEILEQDASNGLIYNYPGLISGSNYRAWLVQTVNSQKTVVSNVLEFTPGPSFGTYSLSIDPTYRLYRTGSIGDSLTWVIEKNGTIVLQRNAANELDYLYYSNTKGSSFRVWLEQVSGYGYYRVSNIIEYDVQ